ncbi:peptidyl-prolyl cis-trans isomerase sig-7 [Melitaea cinxia]|uniref:peptidyl-prolyl cis-trans isomerase sig-7 n=1 Tax=Melitaea cinxia TaxID=113334 RepID=UPI001E274953|nr:peptidyl-prolyl cis-trans isomerase sig-7 [Melitaea cinxia]
MAVVIETTLGDITVDLYLEQRPITCLNFLKLCKMKYYNYNLFHTIRSGFIAQTGDPSGEGSGGQSIWGILEGPQKRFFSGEKMPKIRHTDAGLLSMVCTDDMMVGSQFFITLAPDLDSLDGTHCVIGEVTEGHEVLTKLNEVICDETHRPYRDVRITHTVVLEDPFNDPPGLRAPSRSPSPSAERLKGGRIAPDEEVDETQGKSAEEIQEMIEEKEAKARATILEIVGDLPDAEIAPPENVLFVCKLNPVTTDEDLEIIFSRFGKIVSCEVIRDKKTGNSLQYAFIEFENKKSCEDAYFKMDNVLIDDRRIHVDFSQSVSKMRWLGKGRGVQYFDDDKQMPPRDETRDRQRQHDRRHKDEHNNRERQYDRNENRRDRDHRSEREKTNNKQHKDRSRSRSRLEHSRYRHSERESDRDCKGNSKYRDSQKYDNHDNYKNKHSSSHRSRLSTNYNDSRETSKSPRRHSDKSEYKKKSLEKKNHKNSSSSHKLQTDKYNSKRSNDEDQTQTLSKKEKNVNNHKNPKTPSPEFKQKKEKKNKTKDTAKKITKKYSSKKKRKPSTSSSDSDSSESSDSSSSDSSSSSEDNKRKKRSRKRRRKYSTSSSSSDTSSSNSTSSTDSDTSSSSSDERSKKKGKKPKKKTERKTKKKL